MERRTDAQNETSVPPQLCCWEENFSIKMASNMQKFQIAYYDIVNIFHNVE